MVSPTKRLQSLVSVCEGKRNKVMDYDYLKQFIMERSRRGKKIEQKFLHKKGKTIYNIE